MTQEKQAFSRKVTVRFKPSEFRKLEIAFKQTTHRKLSEYIRNILLEKPVVMLTRDKNADDMVAVFSQIKVELVAIGRNLNQVARIANKNGRLEAGNASLKMIEDTSSSIKLQLSKISQFTTTIHQPWSQG